MIIRNDTMRVICKVIRAILEREGQEIQFILGRKVRVVKYRCDAGQEKRDHHRRSRQPFISGVKV